MRPWEQPPAGFGPAYTSASGRSYATKVKQGDQSARSTSVPPDVSQLAEGERPIPNDDRALVKIHATENRTDCSLRGFEDVTGLDARPPHSNRQRCARGLCQQHHLREVMLDGDVANPEMAFDQGLERTTGLEPATLTLAR
jgi:hypothetical protein